MPRQRRSRSSSSARTRESSRGPRSTAGSTRRASRRRSQRRDPEGPSSTREASSVSTSRRSSRRGVSPLGMVEKGLAEEGTGGATIFLLPSFPPHHTLPTSTHPRFVLTDARRTHPDCPHPIPQASLLKSELPLDRPPSPPARRRRRLPRPRRPRTRWVAERGCPKVHAFWREVERGRSRTNRDHSSSPFPRHPARWPQVYPAKVQQVPDEGWWQEPDAINESSGTISHGWLANLIASTFTSGADKSHHSPFPSSLSPSLHAVITPFRCPPTLPSVSSSTESVSGAASAFCRSVERSTSL